MRNDLKENAEYERQLEDDELDIAIYARSLEEGDNITVTCDLLNAMDQAVDIFNQQKTEIERLTEYNENLNGMCLEFIDKNAELQKQVDKLKKEKMLLIEVCDNCPKVLTEVSQSVKDTAREICALILEHWEKKQFVECDWLRVAIAEKYGVEVE